MPLPATWFSLHKVGSTEEKDPIVLHAPTKKSISLFGTVNVSSGKLLNMVTPVSNDETLKQFIKMLINGIDPMIFYINDAVLYKSSCIGKLLSLQALT